jgi:Ca2+-binding EF-hand superfamily protein
MRVSLSACILLLSCTAASAADSKTLFFSRFDLDRNNRISAEEAGSHARLSRKFQIADLNRDGSLDRAEFAREIADQAVRQRG